MATSSKVGASAFSAPPSLGTWPAVVAAWWESQYFTEQEQAALALAEDVTRLPVPDRRAWDNGSLTDEQVSAISWLAIVMNTWNRIAIRSHYPVGP